MAKFDATSVAKAASRCGEELTRSKLANEGVTHYAIARAIDEGFLSETKAKVRTGKRGRPANRLKLTGKGRRAAAK